MKIPRKLDIACGQNKQEGFTGIDIAGDQADIKHDLNVYPWPIKTSTIEEIFSSHYIEHIPHYRPEFNGVDGWWMFFNEVYRICKNGAKCVFLHPYAKHERAFWDPTHTRYVHEMTWWYLSKEWRELQKLDHYDATCNIVVDGSGIQGVGISGDISTRSQPFQDFGRQHYWNMIPDLQVELKVVK